MRMYFLSLLYTFSICTSKSSSALYGGGAGSWRKHDERKRREKREKRKENLTLLIPPS
jgi:hypothetical protein